VALSRALLQEVIPPLHAPFYGSAYMVSDNESPYLFGSPAADVAGLVYDVVQLYDDKSRYGEGWLNMVTALETLVENVSVSYSTEQATALLLEIYRSDDWRDDHWRKETCPKRTQALTQLLADEVQAHVQKAILLERTLQESDDRGRAYRQLQRALKDLSEAWDGFFDGTLKLMMEQDASDVE
jgi:hypothetical protein